MSKRKGSRAARVRAPREQDWAKTEATRTIDELCELAKRAGSRADAVEEHGRTLRTYFNLLEHAIDDIKPTEAKDFTWYSLLQCLIATKWILTSVAPLSHRTRREAQREQARMASLAHVESVRSPTSEKIISTMIEVGGPRKVLLEKVNNQLRRAGRKKISTRTLYRHIADAKSR